jgi:hypothetical protein
MMLARMTALACPCAALLLCGCYSTSLRGDARADGTTDTAGDTRVDTPADTGMPPDVTPDLTPDLAVDTVPACPEPTAPDVSFSVDLDPAGTPYNILWPCNVAEIAVDSGGSLLYTLQCVVEEGVEQTVEISIWAGPTPNIVLDPDEEVLLWYIATNYWWENRWLQVKDPLGNMIFAAVDAASLAPIDLSPIVFYEPLEVRRRSGLCPAEPTDCGPFERQGLDVSYEGIGRLFYDHSSGAIGDYEAAHVHVGKLTGYTDMECDDIPDTWTNALFAMQVRL